MSSTETAVEDKADASTALKTATQVAGIPRPVVVVFSGGQDSTTCLFHTINATDPETEIYCITIDYGQTHFRELNAAAQVVDQARKFYPNRVIQHEVVALKHVLRGTSPLVQGGDKLEQYENWQSLPGGIEKTFVPLRNQLFLTIAANRAVLLKSQLIVTGVSQEDYGGYPDCREKFLEALEVAINESLAGMHEIVISAPLMHRSKADTVRLAQQLHGCMEALSYSHTAYDGVYPPIGKDHATLLRAKGFAEAGVADPLVVRAWRNGHMPLPDTANYDSLRPVVDKGIVGNEAT